MTNPTTLRAAIRIVTDCLCLTIVCLPTLIAEYDKSIQPFHRGFYCDDETINKPNKPSTIQWKWAISVAVLLPTLTIVIVELIHYLNHPTRSALPDFVLGPIRVNYYVWTLYRFLGLYYFGLAVCMSFGHIGKVTIGRLRPHFLAVCQPDWNRVNCSMYVEEDVCTGDPAEILEARKSFPSGHSTIAFFSMVSTVMYLQCRMPWKSSIVFRHAFQAVLLWMAWYTALSRISDYKHHWSDVLAGSTLGTLAALLVVVYVCDMFRPPGKDIPDDSRLFVEDPSRKISSSSRQSRKISKSSMGHVQEASHGSTELAERTERGLP